MSYASAYHYQIRSKDGTIGYVGTCQGKYVFTPLTYPEFAAAMLMAKALNKRTTNEHEVVAVKKRANTNGRYGPMRRSAIAPVRGDQFERPSPNHEVPPEISKEEYESRDSVSSFYEETSPAGGEDADYVAEYMRRLAGKKPHWKPHSRIGTLENEMDEKMQL